MPRRSKYEVTAVDKRLSDAANHVWGRMELETFSDLLLSMYFTPATLRVRKAADGPDMFEYQHGILVERTWNRVIVPLLRVVPPGRWSGVPDEQRRVAIGAILGNPLAPEVSMRNATERLVFLDGVDLIRESLRQVPLHYR